MKKIVILVFMGIWFSLFGATASSDYINDLKAYLTSKSFAIKGLFYPYDFNNDGYISYNEWVYESVKEHKYYRLLGTEPTPQNAFGFKEIDDIDLCDCDPSGYFIFIDFPRDSDKRFSWIYLSKNAGTIYKLMGADPITHEFDYLQVGNSWALPNLTFNIENGQAFIVYKTVKAFSDIVGGYDTPGFSWNVMRDGNYLYVADGAKGVQVFSIANPYFPEFLYTLHTYGHVYDVAFDASSNFLYIADGKKGVTLYDLSSGDIACNLGLDHAEIIDIALAPDEKTLYLAAGEKGLYIIDVVDKNRIKLLRHIKGCVYQVQVLQGRLYVCDSCKGLGIYDLADAQKPKLLTRVQTHGMKSFSIDSQGDFAYISYWGASKFSIVNLQTQEIQDVSTLYEVYKPVLSPDGQKLYLLNTIATISVWDVSDPQNPSLVKTIYLPYPALDLQFSQDGKFGFIACGGDGIKVVNIE
ncbi:LVIVD repeat-containing protein [Nitratiruptor sp. YY09-18]|uniref:LVIVD repeat-containing protein n=1 Tax=Nitratiruptor sp. YY09-18 TaxID=2724901 RepID=UPI0019166425|nr:hypothetical protein [Nitratiruptor sp. YY09-18]BCD68757.1 hypothetical protein NitYY0918_C1674 [Nitratiruptor sp. YY09-18]